MSEDSILVVCPDWGEIVNLLEKLPESLLQVEAIPGSKLTLRMRDGELYFCTPGALLAGRRFRHVIIYGYLYVGCHEDLRARANVSQWLREVVAMRLTEEAWNRLTHFGEVETEDGIPQVDNIEELILEIEEVET